MKYGNNHPWRRKNDVLNVGFVEKKKKRIQVIKQPKKKVSKDNG